MFPHIGMGELVVLLVIVLLLFGPKRLPELAGSFGKAIRSFKQGLKESQTDEQSSASAIKPDKN